MIDPRIRLRHLSTFMETARLGSLAAAAQVMSVSQPAASKTIRELEEILGVDLFDRSGRRLRLTRAGKLFQQHTGAAMSDLQKAQDLVRDTPRHRTRLLVGALPTASTDLMPLAALKFREAQPDCLLRVSTGPNWLLMSQLREGALDMVVGRMANAEAMEGLSFRPLYAETVVAVVRRGHPLLTHFDQGQIGSYPLLLPPPGAVISSMVRGYLHSAGIPDPQPAFESVALAFGRKVVQMSDTVWFISRGVVRMELDAGTLVALPLEDDLLGGPVGVSMRQQTEATAEQRSLLAILTDTAGRLHQ